MSRWLLGILKVYRRERERERERDDRGKNRGLGETLAKSSPTPPQKTNILFNCFAKGHMIWK
jgi:hypothetical protein